MTGEEIRNDDLANLDRDDDDGRHNIGQHMANQDLDRGGAHGPGGRKIVMLRQTNKISTYRGKCGIGSSKNSLAFCKDAAPVCGNRITERQPSGVPFF